ncbi:MAG TPA: hypothetical protein VFU22_03565 [Roseiflexaceae bacterium]|nr:hypothetical protein [Roseiflexaceae bacterium]
MSYESSDLLNEQVAQAAGFSIVGRTDINSVETALQTLIKECAPWLNWKVAAVFECRAMTTTISQNTQPNTEPADTAEFLFYCDLTPEQRTAHQGLIGQLFGTLVQETRELPDGYAYRFDNEHYPLLTTFITNEQLCCPFLTFELTVTPHRGPVWLQLTAQGDAKPFLREELGHYISQR